MKFREMLDWALRLRALGALRAWVGARGPAGGIGAEVAWLADFGRSTVSRGSTGNPRVAATGQQYPLWVIFA